MLPPSVTKGSKVCRIRTILNLFIFYLCIRFFHIRALLILRLIDGI